MQMSDADKETRILGSIKLAADNPSKLRKIDVYRVLVDAQEQSLLLEAAEFICKARPELEEEVRSCVEDLVAPIVTDTGTQVQTLA